LSNVPAEQPTDALSPAALAQAVADAAWEKKAFDIRAFEVTEQLGYTDVMVLISAASDRQTSAIASSIEDELRKKLGERPGSSEGKSNGRWIVLDYGNVVVHVFHRPVRDYYELDRLYGEAARVPLVEPAWVARLQAAVEDPSVDWGEGALQQAVESFERAGAAPPDGETTEETASA
jgi:ribosome-associated protein